MSDDEPDWENYESGPFCRHWSEPSWCEEKCAACGHGCQSHEFGEGCFACGECECKEWKDRND